MEDYLRVNILVISDSHGKRDRIKEVIGRQIKRPDALIFLGDGLQDLDYCDTTGIALYKVCGNCDLLYLNFITDAPDEQIINLDGVRIMMTHGHNNGVKMTLTPLLTIAAENKVDILLFGHTHQGFEMTLMPDNELGIKLEKPLYVMNPGSLGSYAATFGTISTDSSGRVLMSHGSLIE